MNEEAMANDGPSTPTLQPLSKSAQKKAAKMAHLAALKPLRRAAAKQRKKEALLAAGGPSDEAKRRKKEKLQIQSRWEKDLKREEIWAGQVCVDLGWDDLMTDKEITSVASQLGFLYHNHRSSPQTVSNVIFTNLPASYRNEASTSTKSDESDPHAISSATLTSPNRLSDFFDTTLKGLPQTTWKRVEFTARSLESLLAPLPLSDASALSPLAIAAASSSQSDATIPLTLPEIDPLPVPANLPTAGIDRSSVVYLTSDSPYELSQLPEGYTYVLGGIVDKNRHKGICYKKALELGVRHARLPIGKYLSELKSRHVLTINHVFQILTSTITSASKSPMNQGDWETALREVVPKRKYEEGIPVTPMAKGVEEEELNEQSVAYEVEEMVAEDEMAAFEVDEEAAVLSA